MELKYFQIKSNQPNADEIDKVEGKSNNESVSLEDALYNVLEHIF